MKFNLFLALSLVLGVSAAPAFAGDISNTYTRRNTHGDTKLVVNTDTKTDAHLVVNERLFKMDAVGENAGVVATYHDGVINARGVANNFAEPDPFVIIGETNTVYTESSWSDTNVKLVDKATYDEYQHSYELGVGY